MNTGTHRVHSPLDSWKQISVEMRKREKNLSMGKSRMAVLSVLLVSLSRLWERECCRLFRNTVEWWAEFSSFYSTCVPLASPLLWHGKTDADMRVSATEWCGHSAPSPVTSGHLASCGGWSSLVSPFPLVFLSSPSDIYRLLHFFGWGGGGGSDPLPLLSHSLPSFRQELKVFIFFLPNH